MVCFLYILLITPINFPFRKPSMSFTMLIDFTLIIGQFIFPLNPFRQICHVLIDFGTGNFCINLSCFDREVSHHLAKTLYRNTLGQANGSGIRMSSGMQYSKLPNKLFLTLENCIFGQTYNNSKSILLIF